jgi:hypothetical protein
VTTKDFLKTSVWTLTLVFCGLGVARAQEPFTRDRALKKFSAALELQGADKGGVGLQDRLTLNYKDVISNTGPWDTGPWIVVGLLRTGEDSGQVNHEGIDFGNGETMTLVFTTRRPAKAKEAPVANEKDVLADYDDVDASGEGSGTFYVYDYRSIGTRSFLNGKGTVKIVPKSNTYAADPDSYVNLAKIEGVARVVISFDTGKPSEMICRSPQSGTKISKYRKGFLLCVAKNNSIVLLERRGFTDGQAGAFKSKLNDAGFAQEETPAK